MNQSMMDKLGEFNRIEDIQNKLKVKRATAIKYMHLLRKEGLIKTEYIKNKKRLYRIIKVKKPVIGNESFYYLINKYSPIKIVIRHDYRIIGRKATVEEAIVKTIDTKSLKLILASLALFNHVNNWPLLLRLAKQYNVRRKVGALYELTRRFMKVRRIDKRTLNSLLKAKNESRFIIDNFKSRDFKDLEKKWKVHLPFNKVDIMEYEQWR